ncbi:MAG TPA: glycerol-3-phosphate 1-O-acyltransferase PlsB, partial [Pseudomonadales bacterium]|nr:glycerol-3-phosphate 1-O-acyltransferase PlsB [Pseudomonadales bacterium]
MNYWLGLDRLFIWMVRLFLKLVVRPTIMPERIENTLIDPNKPVCYVLRYKSLSNLIVLDQACKKHNLQRPTAHLETNALKFDRSYFYLSRAESLLDRRHSMRGQAPVLVEILQAAQDNPELDIQIVPVSLFWGRSPDKQDSVVKLLLSDSWAIPTKFRKLLIILWNGRNMLLRFGDPISLRAQVNEGLDEARTLRKLSRVLRVHFRLQKEAVIGPDLSHRRVLVESLLRNENVRKSIKDTAQKNNQPINKVEKEARKYANEIAADYSHPVIRAYYIVLTWLWNKLYDGVEVKFLDRLLKVAQTHEIIYVPCHRSHIDYLLLSYVVYTHGLVPPHIAAGVNLNLPVVGPILRRGGAFFMRRTFKGNPLYTAVFNEYLHTVFSRGFSVEYFIEGGRSRTGRLLSPRTGMLTMTLRSYLRDIRKPMMFVPIYIGYEKVIEGSTYIGELMGKPKKKESIWDIIHTLRAIKGTFGKVHVSFGEPIELNSLFDEYQADWRKFRGHNETPEWLPNATNKLALNIVKHINDAAVANPIGLLAVALLATPKFAMDEPSLIRQLNLYVQLLRKVRYSTSASVTELNGAQIVYYCERIGILLRRKHALGDVLFVTEENAVLLTYFRNNILHFFALPSLVADFFVNNRSLAPERIIHLCETMYPYLQAELFLNLETTEIADRIKDILSALKQARLIQDASVPGELCPPSPTASEFVQLNVLASAIRQTLLRFYMTMATLLKVGSGKVTQAKLADLCHLMAQRVSMLHELNSPEFFDKTLFRTFLDTLKANVFIQTDKDGLIVFGDNLLEMEQEVNQILSG